MGSWTETCFITNLPIVSLDDDNPIPVVALEADYSSIINEMESPFSRNINFAFGDMGCYGDLRNIIYENIFKGSPTWEFDYNSKSIIMFAYRDVWHNLAKFVINKYRANMAFIIPIYCHKYTEDVGKDFKNISLKEFCEKYTIDPELINHKAVLYGLTRARAGFPINLNRGSQDEDLDCRLHIADLTYAKAGMINSARENNDSDF